MPYADKDQRKECANRVYKKRSQDPAYREKQAARARRRRAAMTAEQKEEYAKVKRAQAKMARQDPEAKKRDNEASSAWYAAAKADGVVWARVQKSARERYWKNQPWRILQGTALRAKKKGMEFDLTKEWLATAWTGRCALTGIEFVLRSSTICPYSPSIDRIDNEKGYTQSNCRFVLYGLNAAKNTGTDADLLRMAKALVAMNA